jgi:Flp pilus assembly protein TadG
VRALAGDRLGSAAIEFAVVFPVFLIVLLGTFAYGIYIGTAHSLAQLAADAARASVAGLDDQERAKIAKASITESANNYPLLNAQSLVVDAGPLADDPNEFRVAVAYDASRLPIWGFAKFLPLPATTIKSSATVRRGGL